jgi:hypothetical protein
MLPRDDPRWSKLSSPGGPVNELLTALKTLDTSPKKARLAIGVIFDFACHQYSVYGTTVAVVPHMIRAASRLPPKHHNRYELLATAGLFALLVGRSAGRLCPTSMSAVLKKAFAEAIRSAAPLVAVSLLESWPENEYARLLAALAAFTGHPQLSGLLSRASESIACPSCGAEFETLAEWGDTYR